MRQPAAGRVQADSGHAPHWHGLPCWRILDTDFADGQAFLATWQRWRADTQAPRLLHYVAFCQHPADATELIRACADEPQRLALARLLLVQWFGLLPGFHRLAFEQGRVLLTLCVGDGHALLRQQQFEADAITLWAQQSSTAEAPEPWTAWFIKALVRCCRRGTRLSVISDHWIEPSPLQSLLVQCGFRLAVPPSPFHGSSLLEAHFDPPWPLKNSRHNALPPALPIQRCAVVGAGLAGASVAASLARRGWQVTVLDQAGTPAAGASGLPVGLVAPHVSSDDCVLSRLSRAGVRMMLQQAREQLRAGQDWIPSGVLERQVGGTPQLPNAWTEPGRQWSRDCRDTASGAGANSWGDGVWHHQGAWLKPAQLVRTWLNQPGVTFQADSEVRTLRRQHGVWDLLDDAGQVLCSAERVVFANACGLQALLQTLQSEYPDLALALEHLPALQGMRGLLSWTLHTDTPAVAFPPWPINGAGSIIPDIPWLGGRAWFMGSTYQPERQSERSDRDNHLGNFEHLQQLLPELAKALAPIFDAGPLHAWKNTRCVTADRLPLVGPIDSGDQPSLWLCAGMGSRGLSFSVLCAELMAARWGAEPLPVEASLAKSLTALRATPRRSANSPQPGKSRQEH